MKKLVIAALSLVIALSLALCACAEGKTLTIGIMQQAENGAFADMRQGFIDQMAANGYVEGENVTYVLQNALGDTSLLAGMTDALVDAECDLVVTIATASSKTFVNADTGIPCFFISVSDPLAAGVVTEMAHPDKNATGTSNAIPVDEMFSLAETLTPGCQTYGLIYATSQTNSVSTIESAKAYMDANGLSYVEVTVETSADVQAAAESLAAKEVDAIFVPNDAIVQAGMTALSNVAIEYDIPVYGSSAVMVNSGAFATIAIGDHDIGAITADMAIEYLNGTAIEDIPAIVVDQFTLVINKTTADAIGVTIPEEVAAAENTQIVE